MKKLRMIWYRNLL